MSTNIYKDLRILSLVLLLTKKHHRDPYTVTKPGFAVASVCAGSPPTGRSVSMHN